MITSKKIIFLSSSYWTLIIILHLNSPQHRSPNCVSPARLHVKAHSGQNGTKSTEPSIQIRQRLPLKKLIYYRNWQQLNYRWFEAERYEINFVNRILRTNSTKAEEIWSVDEDKTKLTNRLCKALGTLEKHSFHY